MREIILYGTNLAAHRDGGQRTISRRHYRYCDRCGEQHHSQDCAQVKDQQIANGEKRRSDRRQGHQRDCRRSRESVNHSHHHGTDQAVTADLSRDAIDDRASPALTRFVFSDKDSRR